MTDDSADALEEYKKIYSLSISLDIPEGETFYQRDLTTIEDLVRHGLYCPVDEKGVMTIRGGKYTVWVGSSYVEATLYDGEGNMLPDVPEHRAVAKELQDVIDKRLEERADVFRRDNPDAIWS